MTNLVVKRPVLQSGSRGSIPFGSTIKQNQEFLENKELPMKEKTMFIPH